MTSTPDLPNAFRDDVGHGEKLLGVFIEKQMIIAEVMPAHMPVKIFRFQVQSEHICKDCVHRAGDVLRRFRRKIGSCSQRSFASTQQLCPSRIRLARFRPSCDLVFILEDSTSFDGNIGALARVFAARNEKYGIPLSGYSSLLSQRAFASSERGTDKMQREGRGITHLNVRLHFGVAHARHFDD